MNQNNVPHNAPHQRQNGRVASILSDCMRLLGILFVQVFPCDQSIKFSNWNITYI